MSHGGGGCRRGFMWGMGGTGLYVGGDVDVVGCWMLDVGGEILGAGGVCCVFQLGGVEIVVLITENVRSCRSLSQDVGGLESACRLATS